MGIRRTRDHSADLHNFSNQTSALLSHHRAPSPLSCFKLLISLHVFRQSLVSVVDRHVHATNRQENRCIPEVLQCQNFTEPVFGIAAPRVSLSSGKSRRSSHPSGTVRISRLSLRVGRKEIIRRRDDKTQRGALLLG